MPKHEPEVEQALTARIADIKRRLSAVGLPTDASGAFDPEVAAELQGLSPNDRVVTAVITSVLYLMQEHSGGPEELIEELSSLIEVALLQGGIMGLEQVVIANEKCLAEMPPEVRDDWRTQYYILAKCVTTGVTALGKRRDKLRLDIFTKFANRAILKAKELKS